jgi:hypothetical protein
MILGGSIITGGRNSSSHKNCEEFDKMNVLLCIISMKISSSININLLRAMLRVSSIILFENFVIIGKKAPPTDKIINHDIIYFSSFLIF